MTNRYGDSGLFDPIHGDGYDAPPPDDKASGRASKQSKDSPNRVARPEDDVGPPPPGADGDYPDPEIGLEC